MTTRLVAQEIKSFLRSTEPEVLCVRGEWGVGKTFAWRHYLSEATDSQRLAAQSYAYVSLFGLNSLDDLRYAIFESTVPPGHALTGPDAETFRGLVNKGLSIGRRSRTWLSPVSNWFGLGDFGTALARSTFLLVRNQLICIDDMERAGADLKPRDVLGLISFLKEQRNCRVAILLNDGAMPNEDQAEFLRLLEKVVDVSVTFAPTPSEAAAIAISDDEPLGAKLRKITSSLGITNIRVIKKIERLALQLANLLETFRPEILDQALVASALGGWSTYQPDQAPPSDFIVEFNSIISAMQDVEADLPNVVRWRDKLTDINYSHCDDFDRMIIQGVKRGFFDQEALLAEAKSLEALHRRDTSRSSFSEAWRLQRETLSLDDEVVLNAILKGAKENIDRISPADLNATVQILRENGRSDDADSIIELYVDARRENPEFFDLSKHMFMNNATLDPALETAFKELYATYVDPRDPQALLNDLVKASGWNSEDVRLLSTVSADEYQRILEGTEGPTLRPMVQLLLRMSSHAGEDEARMKPSFIEALSRIGRKSPLRAKRLRGWGFDIDAHN